MRILVTGAAGFIGTHLLRELDIESHDPVATDFRPLPTASEEDIVGYFRWDIRNDSEIPAFVEEARGCDALIHLAAIASPRECSADQSVAWETNVRGTANVLTLARLAGIPRVVFLSSAHVYGISPRYLPTDEQHPLALHDPYTMTKIAGESFCQFFYENYGISYCNLRLFNCYGWGQSPLYFFGAKLRSAARDGAVVVPGAAVTKDWVAVEDVIMAIEQAARSAFVGAVNIGTGVETSLGTIGRAIAEGFGASYEQMETIDAGPSRMAADWRRAERTFGWRPTLPFSERLRRLILRAKAEKESL